LRFQVGNQFLEIIMSLEKMEVVNPFLVNEVVNSFNHTEFLNSNMDVSTPTSFTGVSRDVIPVDLGGLRELRFTDVAPGTTVPEHSHRSPIFRLITQGEATVNGTLYKKGDWMVIPAGTPYKINTVTGYSAAWNCVVCW
jgi:hypothetical protein